MTTGADLTCREMIDFLDDYLDQTVDAAAHVRFQKHLEKCPPCRDYLRTYRDTIRLAGGLCGDDADAPPAGMPDKLVKAILDARRGG